MPIRLPRILRMNTSPRPISSCPSNRMLPPGWLARGYGRSWRIESDVTDLPEPLSPTIARVSRRSSVKLASLTASTGSPSPAKVTFRPRTSSSGTAPVLLGQGLARVEGVADRLPEEEEEREHERYDDEA